MVCNEYWSLIRFAFCTPLVSLNPGTWVEYILNILVVGAEGDIEDRPLVLVWFVVLDAASVNLFVDVNGDVDTVVFLASAICEDTVDVPKIIVKTTNIAWFLANNTVPKSITFEFNNTCYDYHWL